MQNLQLSLGLSVTLLALAVSCRASNQDSGTLEAWDSRNDPGIFGAAPVTYDTLSKPEYLQGRFERIPWTDTYWPLTDGGFAARWIDHGNIRPFDLSTDTNDPDYDTKTREELRRHLEDARALTAKPWSETIGISPAEKYDIGVGDASMRLTTAELGSFAGNRRAYKDIDWGWMGHCHGWAPASFLFEQPRHGVLMKNNTTSNQVLFTTGDIRGLLTKAAADNPFTEPESFMGTRCNDPAREIPKDELKRVIDGAIGTWDATSQTFSNHKPVRILLNNWFNYSELNVQGVEMVFQFGPKYHTSKRYWMRAMRWRDRNKKIVDVEIYSTKMQNGELSKDMLLVSTDPSLIGRSMDANDQWVRNTDGSFKQDKEAVRQLWARVVSDTGIKDPARYLSFKYYKECRDLNPGALHLVLAAYLSDGVVAGGQKARSFVLDITRDDQVWNHAIYSYETKLGQPTPLTVEGVRDPFMRWRAPGTRNIVDVFTKVVYAVENGPRLVYTQDDEAMHSKTYHYTLELDSGGKVIGGEWHGLVADAEFRPDVPASDLLSPKSGKGLLQNLQNIVASDDRPSESNSPDFIWGFKPGTFVRDGKIIKADFVKAVHQCSLDESPGVRSTTVGSTEVRYVECTY